MFIGYSADTPASVVLQSLNNIGTKADIEDDFEVTIDPYFYCAMLHDFTIYSMIEFVVMSCQV